MATNSSSSGLPAGRRYTDITFTECDQFRIELHPYDMPDSRVSRKKADDLWFKNTSCDVKIYHTYEPDPCIYGAPPIPCDQTNITCVDLDGGGAGDVATASSSLGNAASQSLNRVEFSTQPNKLGTWLVPLCAFMSINPLVAFFDDAFNLSASLAAAIDPEPRALYLNLPAQMAGVHVAIFRLTAQVVDSTGQTNNTFVWYWYFVDISAVCNGGDAFGNCVVTLPSSLNGGNSANICEDATAEFGNARDKCAHVIPGGSAAAGCEFVAETLPTAAFKRPQLAQTARATVLLNPDKYLSAPRPRLAVHADSCAEWVKKKSLAQAGVAKRNEMDIAYQEEIRMTAFERAARNKPPAQAPTYFNNTGTFPCSVALAQQYNSAEYSCFFSAISGKAVAIESFALNTTAAFVSATAPAIIEYPVEELFNYMLLTFARPEDIPRSYRTQNPDDYSRVKLYDRNLSAIPGRYDKLPTSLDKYVGNKDIFSRGRYGFASIWEMPGIHTFTFSVTCSNCINSITVNGTLHDPECAQSYPDTHTCTGSVVVPRTMCENLDGGDAGPLVVSMEVSTAPPVSQYRDLFGRGGTADCGSALPHEAHRTCPRFCSGGNALEGCSSFYSLCSDLNGGGAGFAPEEAVAKTFGTAAADCKVLCGGGGANYVCGVVAPSRCPG